MEQRLRSLALTKATAIEIAGHGAAIEIAGKYKDSPTGGPQWLQNGVVAK